MPYCYPYCYHIFLYIVSYNAAITQSDLSDKGYILGYFIISKSSWIVLNPLHYHIDAMAFYPPTPQVF